MRFDTPPPVEHDFGLAYDLTTMYGRFDRRRTLKLLAGLGALTLVGCGSDDDDESAGGATTTAGAGQTPTTGTAAPATTVAATTTVAAATGGPCTKIPTETAGPYPGARHGVQRRVEPAAGRRHRRRQQRVRCVAARAGVVSRPARRRGAPRPGGPGG